MELQISIPHPGLCLDTAEQELVDRARHDREAFAMLYRRHQAVIAGYIQRRVGDAHATEDLVADVFLAALRYLPKYRHRGLPIRAWLYRIATNTVNRWIRIQRRQIFRQFRQLPVGENHDVVRSTPVRESSASVHAGNASIPALDAVAASGADGGADTERARLALLTLPPKYQTVISLHYLEGLSLEEIAAAVGCRLGTVKSRLSRGREALREKLLRRRNQHGS